MKDKQRSTSPMEGKHTPGPWTADEFGYINAGGQQIADVYVYDSSDCMDCGQCEAHSVRDEPKLPYKANARLMAAAPEMYEFIKDLASTPTPPGSMPYNCYADSLLDAVSDAKGLIEKIEGDE